MLHALLTISAGLFGTFSPATSCDAGFDSWTPSSPPWPLLDLGALPQHSWRGPPFLLPFVTLITAITFGIGTGFGTASGVRALKRNDNLRRLAP